MQHDGMSVRELRRAIKHVTDIWVTVVATPDDIYQFRISKPMARKMARDMGHGTDVVFKAMIDGNQLIIG